MFCFDRCPFDDEEVETTTSKAQDQTELAVFKAYQTWRQRFTPSKYPHALPSPQSPQSAPDPRILFRENHVSWLLNAIRKPPNRYSSAVIHPWLVFWIIQSLALLDTTPILTPEQRQDEARAQQESEQQNDLDSPTPISPSTIRLNTSDTNQSASIWTQDFGRELITFMKRFEHPDGGYCGHFGGDAHLIVSYAATMAIVIVGTRCGIYDEAYNSINIPKYLQFLKSLKVADRSDENYGSYYTCLDGEADTRSVFAAMVVLDLLGQLPNQELTDGTVDWLSRCQNYDGGFSCEPGVESHGGYTLTALSSLVVLEATDRIDLDLLEKWCVTKQLEREGGFCGRTHKLVDSCYSFWVGSSISLIQVARQQILDLRSGASVPTLNFTTHEDRISPSQQTCSNSDVVILPPPELGWMFDQQALQCYLLVCCQDKPGFRDKPGVSPDFYHTCYSLSGLSTAQTSVTFPKLSYSYINQHTQNQPTRSDEPHSATSDSTPTTTTTPLSQETLDLIAKYKHPTIYRFGDTQAKLQPNNIIYNIPQGCYSIAHSFNQRRKLEEQLSRQSGGLQ